MGAHKYDESGTSDCHYGCGCWAGDYSSGGPDGVDPTGDCPKNPKHQPDGCETCENADEVGYSKLSHFNLGTKYGNWLKVVNTGDVFGIAKYIEAHADDPEAIRNICAGILQGTKE